MKTKLYISLITSCLFFLLVGCKSNSVNIKYQNGQIALITNNKNGFELNDENKISYKSVSDDITISFETFNAENNNVLIVNNHEISLESSTERNVFVKNEIVILGANVKNGELNITIKVGDDDFGNLDTFKIRNVFINIKGEEIWANKYSKEEYWNEAFNFGAENYQTDYRFNYKSSRDFSFVIPQNLLDCQALLADNNKEEFIIKCNEKEIKLLNEAYVNLEININENANINDDHELIIVTKGDVLEVKTFMDGLLIPNDLKLSSNAWASGKHSLKAMAMNKYGFIVEKNVGFTLGAIKATTASLNYKMYDPGLADNLPNSINSLGKKVSGSNYKSGFSAVPYINYEITPTTDLTFQWSGIVPNNRTVFMQFYNSAKKTYETVSTAVSTGQAAISVGHGLSDAKDYITGGKIYIRVANINQAIEKKITASIYHITDVQYITQKASLNKGSTMNKEAKQALKSISDFLIAQNSNTTYSVFTGDFVQTMRNADIEWEAVMEDLFTPLLNSEVRFGASTGNHDVGGLSENSLAGSNALDDELYYDYFSNNLGAKVFENRGYYGGSYKDNRSHYDLITLGGHEFLFLYLGWGSSTTGIHVSSQDIEYAKTILTQYPNKSVILATHNYMGPTNTRNATGQYVFNALVKEYANIKMVLSGHVNGTSKTIDYLDDNGDGITDRQVLQLLTDFQEEENLYGATFIRKIGLDFSNNQMIFALYSPFFNATEIIVNGNPQVVNDNSQFIYDFDLNNLGYGMISNSLE